ncbi:MBOAT family protein [Synechococcus moorigangaii CMS01]|nr:MBOAT family protein [Synechococcus moorigangaii CMS01]
MTLVSFAYGCFLLVTLVGYWGLGRVWPLLRPWLLLGASVVFYGLLQPQFLPLLLGLTVLNFSWGRFLERWGQRGDRPRNHFQEAFRVWHWQRGYCLGVGIFLNLAVLFGFKYVAFTLTNLAWLWPAPWLQQGAIATETLIAPVGISFFTFECIAYLVDIYRGAPASTSLLTFSSYKLFFPKLLSGPITRFHYFRGQTQGARGLLLDEGVEGLWLIASGAVKKGLIADNLGVFVALCANNLERAGSGDLWLFVLTYGLQLYFDFSGYVDLALGSARLLGFKLPDNFDFPYFSTSLADFWRRWHMSLGDWLRNYLYFPLGGSRKSLGRTCLNLFVVMLLAGLWHGAAWGYVLWGCLHGFGLGVHRLSVWFTKRWSWLERFWQSVPGLISTWLLTQGFVFLSWIPFRLPTGSQASLLVRHLWQHQGDVQFTQKIYLEGLRLQRADFVGLLLLLLLGMVCAYGVQRQWQLHLNWVVKVALIPLCFYGVWLLAPEGNIPYIYFDF